MQTKPITKKWFNISIVVFVIVLIAYIGGYMPWYAGFICIAPLWRAFLLLGRDRDIKPGW